jgi:hypothetical protein
VKPQKALRRIAEAFRDDRLSVVVIMSDGRSLRGRIIDSSSASDPIGVAGEMVPGPISIKLVIEVGQ